MFEMIRMLQSEPEEFGFPLETHDSQPARFFQTPVAMKSRQGIRGGPQTHVEKDEFPVLVGHEFFP
ncbi:MAG TPA: hypothetical protein PL182_04720 [Pseudobdellovibrionaceae bacterium]|nr:hypothetical protein [Pseudobdellovibrionaceae bacterium]